VVLYADSSRKYVDRVLRDLEYLKNKRKRTYSEDAIFEWAHKDRYLARHLYFCAWTLCQKVFINKDYSYISEIEENINQINVAKFLKTYPLKDNKSFYRLRSHYHETFRKAHFPDDDGPNRTGNSLPRH